MLEFLEQEGVRPALVEEVRAFRAQHPAPAGMEDRIPQPKYHYYGSEIWEEALAALLCGKNLLLAGGKATGKNVLAENLAAAFGRPAWNVSRIRNTFKALRRILHRLTFKGLKD